MKTTDAIKDCQSPKSRHCRAYRHRTLCYMEKAISSWESVYSEVPPSFKGRMNFSCKTLAQEVKRFLSLKVSEDKGAQLSWNLIKKGLPDSCQCLSRGMLDQLVAKFTMKPEKLPENYLRFVQREIRKLFPPGWDKGYQSQCLMTSPPLSSVHSENLGEGNRASGGCLGEIGCDQSEYLDCVMNGIGEVGDIAASLMVIQSSGKPRPLTKFSSNSLSVKPLHKTIYGHMKKFNWLLVGPPTRERLRRAGFEKGKGELVSGDYASATDGLSIEVAEMIIDTILSTSKFVPENIKVASKEILRPLILNPISKETFRPTVGQMMGSYLSFPLLCLQNFLAFRWSVGRSEKVPLLINGDDILFQKDNHFPEWVRAVNRVGFVVERTKTDVSNDFGTINSQLLKWDGNLLSTSWVMRTGMFRAPEHEGSLGYTYREFLLGCSDPTVRYRAAKEFFSWHCGTLARLGVSLPSLGFRGTLALRLAKSFGFLFFPDVEVPQYFHRHGVRANPDDVVEVERDILSDEELFFNGLEMCSSKWNTGWKQEDIVSNAISYCQKLTALRPSVFIPRFENYQCSDKEFQFRIKPTREVKLFCRKKFFEPIGKKQTVLFNYNVFCQISVYFEELPPYSVGIDNGAA